MEYAGRVASAAISGEAAFRIEDDGVAIVALFDVCHLSYADITAFAVKEHALSILTEQDTFLITRLGNACDAFLAELYAAYNKKVRKALFVRGKPLLETRGEYRYDEGGVITQGNALIEVYENCVLILPPDDGARRIPLCFLHEMDQGDFTLTLTLDTGESYSLLRLGYDSTPFAECIRQRLRALRENALDAAKALDGSLASSPLSAIAKLMPEGVAVPLHRLHAIAPSFVTALEAKIADSRVAEEYRVFQEVCDPKRICAGMKSGLAGEDAENILWLIAPGGKPGVAAVELATSEETAAATFLYRGFEEWEDFRRKLNQAMEAVHFKREVIRLTEEELRRSEYADYAMAVRRNRSLRFMRAHFAGRVIHASAEGWKRELLAFMQ